MLAGYVALYLLGGALTSWWLFRVLTRDFGPRPRDAERCAEALIFWPLCLPLIAWIAWKLRKRKEPNED